jgi:hypothetical protein
MISWDLEWIDVQTRTILDSQGIFINSFILEHIQVMYKMSPNSKYIYNKEFVSELQRKECREADQTYPDIIKHWWRHPAKFRVDTHNVYAIDSLNKYRFMWR